jgi:CRISPR-associated protein Cas1
MPLHAIVHSESFARQISCDESFSGAAWRRVVQAKLRNQALLLDAIHAEHDIWKMLEKPEPDEANAARHYWKRYFRMFGRKRPKTRERKDAEHPVNQLLNYGYAVLSAILHRSLVIHGLNPALGIHHRYRFKSDPLVYDFFEPLRPVCDFMLLRYHLLNQRRDMAEWTKHTAKELVEFRIKTEGENKSLKLVNAIDRYAASAARAFETGRAELLCPPILPELRFDTRG